MLTYAANDLCFAHWRLFAVSICSIKLVTRIASFCLAYFWVRITFETSEAFGVVCIPGIRDLSGTLCISWKKGISLKIKILIFWWRVVLLMNNYCTLIAESHFWNFANHELIRNGFYVTGVLLTKFVSPFCHFYLSISLVKGNWSV